MIFVTVGEQLPFDRLIRIVDGWAANTGQDVFAQIGRTKWNPKHISHSNFLEQYEFKDKLMSADLIVAHAGIGTIISALEMGKPILVMPRQSALGEARNDHQLATSKRFQALNYVSVAFDETELLSKLDNLDEVVQNQSGQKTIDPSPLLIKTIRNFIIDDTMREMSLSS